MKTISDFPLTIWNQTSVKQNSDIQQHPFACRCSTNTSRFVLKELLLVDWKAFAFYSEDWRIHVDTVIYYKDLVD